MRAHASPLGQRVFNRAYKMRAHASPIGQRVCYRAIRAYKMREHALAQDKGYLM